MSIHWRELGTEAKIEAIRSVWEPGVTSRYIAAHFNGATRNAIIGIYGRYPDKLMNYPLPTTKRAATAERKGRMVSLCRPASKPRRHAPVMTNETHLCGKPLLMLGVKECKWVVNEATHDERHLFCALPAERSYCSHHETRASQPRQA